MPSSTADNLGAPTTHPFTCNTCQVAFRSSDAQRTHMRSDWHRYNLKRRVASLPPLSSETFAEKVLSVQASNSAAAARATFEKTCTACQKTYYSENAFINHMGSQKHRLKEALLRKNGGHLDDSASVVSGAFSMGEPINVPPNVVSPETIVEEEFSAIVDGMKDTSVDAKDPVAGRPHRPSQSRSSDSRRPSVSTKMEIDAVTVSRCLFCNYDSSDINENVSHMHKSHGMFIPEQDYLVDLEGLIKYLQAKVMQNNECLYCHKLKTTTPGIQTHMRDKGHCMIAFESEEEMIEIGQFYDFTSTYSDDEEEEYSDRRRDGAVDGSAEEDDGWETDTSASSLDSAELGAVPIDDYSHQYSKLSKHKHHSHEPRSHRNLDGFHSHAHEHTRAVFYSDYELHLPSGRTAGHRALAKYYRQNLRDYPTPEERFSRQQAIEAAPSGETQEGETEAAFQNKNRALISRANGGIGMLGATASQKQEVRAAEVRDRKREQRSERAFQWAVSKRANHQKHFRDHLLQ
ncbi:cytoplasm protein [Coccidioides immitis H538.4]|uniref:Cytoplasm protein n=1 Tax=Coccidioides immitis H538.4 TaxID=396776 RepID=A0A0J8RHW9_COCIT|nr:cytoplasm protein [Coccidioides immitis H538.4]